MKKSVDITITSANGCEVHIVGTVEISLMPPGIDHFSGTVTISGGKGCPNATLPFTRPVPREGNGFPKKSKKGLFVRLDSENPNRVRSALWLDNTSEAVQLLSEPKVNREFCAAISENRCEAMIL